MPYEHFDNLGFAAPIAVAQPNAPLGTDAMINEHLTNGITSWSFATPGNRRSHHASTPCNTVFA